MSSSPNEFRVCCRDAVKILHAPALTRVLNDMMSHTRLFLPDQGGVGWGCWVPQRSFVWWLLTICFLIGMSPTQIQRNMLGLFASISVYHVTDQSRLHPVVTHSTADKVTDRACQLQKNHHHGLKGCSGELLWRMLCSPLTVAIHSAQEEEMLKPTQHCSWEVSLTGLKSACWMAQTSSVSSSLAHRVGDSRVVSSPATPTGFIQLTKIVLLFKILEFSTILFENSFTK